MLNKIKSNPHSHQRDLKQLERENSRLPEGYSIILQALYYPQHKGVVVYKAGFTNIRDARYFILGHNAAKETL